MRFTAAIVREQGVTFTVFLVKSGVINSGRRESVRSSVPANLPRPIILAEQKSNGRMQYHGRQDIVRFLSKLPFQSLPWKEYS